MLDVNAVNIYVLVGFAVDEVAWWQVYFPELWFYRVAVTSALHNNTSTHH
jgi:hypothetical protein